MSSSPSACSRRAPARTVGRGGRGRQQGEKKKGREGGSRERGREGRSERGKEGESRERGREGVRSERGAGREEWIRCKKQAPYHIRTHPSIIDTHSHTCSDTCAHAHMYVHTCTNEPSAHTTYTNTKTS